MQRALPPIYLVQVYTLEWRYGSVLFGSTVAYSPREVSASPAAPGRDVPPPLLGTHESDADARAAHASPWNPMAQGLTRGVAGGVQCSVAEFSVCAEGF